MKALLRLLSWRHSRVHLLRTLLCVASVALGVALFVSTEVSHTSTTRAFEESARRLAGKARWQVRRGRGLGADADALAKLDAVPGAVAAPRIEVSALVYEPDAPGALVVLGVDFAREMQLRDMSLAGTGGTLDPVQLVLRRDVVVLTATWARENGVAVGSKLTIQTRQGLREIAVAGVLGEGDLDHVLGGRIAFMPIGSVQRLFGREGSYDRIAVALPDGEETPARIESALGPEYVVEPAVAGDKTFEDVLANLRSLVILSVIALLVGLFIVYLSISIGIVERSKAIGTVRAIGASRKQVSRLFLAEAAILGVVGSVLGVLLGLGLAWVSLEYVSGLVNLLVFQVVIDQLELEPVTVLVGLVMGTGTAVLAAWVPARRAASISPAEAMRPAMLGSRLLPDYGRAFWLGFPLAAAGVFASMVPVRYMPIALAYACPLMLFVGVAFAMPQVTIWVSRLVRRPLRALTRATGLLATENVLRYPQRSALTAVALAGALGMNIVGSAQVLSFRVATERWVDRVLPFDVTVQAARGGGLYSTDTLPFELLERVAEVDGVRTTYGVRSRIQEYGEEDVLILAIDLDPYEQVLKARGKPLLEGFPTPEAQSAVVEGRAVVLSTNFAALHGVGIGDRIHLRTPSGPRDFPVVHVAEDFSWPKGTVIVDLGLYREAWQDDRLSYVDVVAEPEVEVQAVMDRIHDELQGEYGLHVLTGEDIRETVHWSIDQSFRLMQAQVLVAMGIGFLGIVNTLLISVLSRKREIGLLRVVGMSRRQTGWTVVSEALLIAVPAGLLGVVAGLFASAWPAAAFMAIVTGYELPFVVPWSTVVQVLLAAFVLGFVASLVPARRAARTDLLQAVGYE